VLSLNFGGSQGDSAVAIRAIVSAGVARGRLTVRERALRSLIASIVAAVLLLAMEKATNARAHFLLRLPGFVASVSIWGVHSGPENPVAGFIVFSAANALAYWPVAFGLGFLLRNKRSNLPTTGFSPNLEI
jgi:hypothetical protein